MEYKKLNFEDYFTICSQNYGGVQTDLELAKYKSIKYTVKGKEHSVEYQVRYDEARNCIQCIFEATVGKSDWLANFNFPVKIYDEFTYKGEVIQLKVHRGWGDMWLAAQDTVRRAVKKLLKIHPGAYIEVFGWSLGSAVSQLCAEDLYFKFGLKPYLYTYGSVKPLFGKKTYNYCQECCEKVYNFYDHNDVVGYMVPLFGYRAINHVKIKQDSFCIVKLFKPQKYHCEYWKSEYYINIQ